mmetsp:Transcript_385/g.719  ORF Transcript_385/g.719 Transcript_385/m.719 type:complete len:318 (+) Transcript_385:105-1058(+)
MTRKSKQPGGHNPLTYHEQKRLKSSGYGTQSTRLTTDSQLPFGHCCLSLSPAISDSRSGASGASGGGGVVATPSGHIYSREAIVQYLLTKNGEVKKQKAEYDRKRLAIEDRRVEWEEKIRQQAENLFSRKDQGAMVVRKEDLSPAKLSGGTKTDEKKKTSENSLKTTSYWLASSQPQREVKASGEFDYEKEINALPPPPPERPASPMSGNPLKLKQLIPLKLVREEEDDKKARGADPGRVLCSVSGKVITTQAVVAIRSSGQVMLKSVYDELAKPTMTCPVTGKKFKEKDVVELQKSSSGFAASGQVIATKYNPTLT